jgi:hypothetical protein
VSTDRPQNEGPASKFIPIGASRNPFATVLNVPREMRPPIRGRVDPFVCEKYVAAATATGSWRARKSKCRQTYNLELCPRLRLPLLLSQQKGRANRPLSRSSRLQQTRRVDRDKRAATLHLFIRWVRVGSAPNLTLMRRGYYVVVARPRDGFRTKPSLPMLLVPSCVLCLQGSHDGYSRPTTTFGWSRCSTHHASRTQPLCHCLSKTAPDALSCNR